MQFSRFFDRFRSKEDLKLRALVANSYSSSRVVGRGTVVVSASEVRSSDEFKKALERAKSVVINRQ